MDKRIHLLLLDDHPVMIDGYEKALEVMDYLFFTQRCYTIDQAVSYIFASKEQNKPIDLAFIDIGLPASKNKRYVSGQDVAIQLKRVFPDVKIIIPTLYDSLERIRIIADTVNPDAILLKDEFTGWEIRSAVEKVMLGETYFTPRVQTMLSESSIAIDDLDLKILSCLAKQIRIKDMPDYIPLALRTIEERKSALMDKLAIDSRKNQDLLEVARKKGLI